MISLLRRTAASVAIVSALFLAPAAMAQAPAPAVVAAAPGQGPAMWVIRDNDSTIYLYGSFHMLKPTTAWGQAHVDQAFAASDQVWFELVDGDDEAKMVTLIQQLGLSPERPLSTVLDPQDMEALRQVAASIGLPPQALEAMRPWLASLQLAFVQMQIGGYDPNLGVDKLLMARAIQQGKPIKGLETAAEQFGILAGISEPGQIDMLQGTLRDIDKAPQETDLLMQAWATGDVAGIEALMISEMMTDQPEAYQAMLVRRNANWAEQIKQLLAGSGTTFIVVGAAHLAGEDSVQAMLATDGIVAQSVAP